MMKKKIPDLSQVRSTDILYLPIKRTARAQQVFCGVRAKVAQPPPNCEKISGKDKLRNIVQNNTLEKCQSHKLSQTGDYEA